MEENIRKKYDLLMQPVWTVSDIMFYFNQNIKSKPTAYRIKNMARDLYNGRTTLGKQYIKRDAVLQCFGTTAEAELKNIRLVVDNEELQKRDL